MENFVHYCTNDNFVNDKNNKILKIILNR